MNHITPFKIDFPLKILDKSLTIDLKDKKIQDRVFKRNIFYYLYDNMENRLMEKKRTEYLGLTQKILEHLNKNHHSLNPLSISLFGSALFSENPSDWDFLVITEGDAFLNEEKNLYYGGKNKTGISIKGIEHLSKGFCGAPSKKPRKNLDKIIERTTAGLFKRNIPTWGYDFIENKKTFSENLLAQASDLLDNTFNLYYLDCRSRIQEKKRARKILTRTYQSATYLRSFKENPESIKLQKDSYISMEKGAPLSLSKETFERAVSLYHKYLNNPHNNK